MKIVDYFFRLVMVRANISANDVFEESFFSFCELLKGSSRKKDLYVVQILKYWPYNFCNDLSNVLFRFNLLPTGAVCEIMVDIDVDNTSFILVRALTDIGIILDANGECPDMYNGNVVNASVNCVLTSSSNWKEHQIFKIWKDF